MYLLTLHTPEAFKTGERMSSSRELYVTKSNMVGCGVTKLSIVNDGGQTYWLSGAARRFNMPRANGG